jgi:hypothetical protein
VSADRERVNDEVERLASADYYAIVKNAGSGTPCPIKGCRLSAEEHHRLVYGVILENSELRKRLRILENG